MKEFEQLELNDCVLSSESRQSQTPRGTRLTAHRSIGAALHTLDHQFSKSRHRKTSWQDYNANPASRPGSRGRPTWRYAPWRRFKNTRARSTRIGLGRVISLPSRGLDRGGRARPPPGSPKIKWGNRQRKTSWEDYSQGGVLHWRYGPSPPGMRGRRGPGCGCE